MAENGTYCVKFSKDYFCHNFVSFLQENHLSNTDGTWWNSTSLKDKSSQLRFNTETALPLKTDEYEETAKLTTSLTVIAIVTFTTLGILICISKRY